MKAMCGALMNNGGKCKLKGYFGGLCLRHYCKYMKVKGRKQGDHYNRYKVN